MPAHKGLQTFRNLRTIAVQKGTTPAGFGEVLDPTAPWSTAYRDAACEGAKPPPSAATQAPDPQPVPFKLR